MSLGFILVLCPRSRRRNSLLSMRTVPVQRMLAHRGLGTERRRCNSCSKTMCSTLTGGELTRGSEAIAIGPQVFDLLVYLVKNRDRVVSKDDLLDAVWAGRIVSEIDADQPHQRGAQGDRRQRRGPAPAPNDRPQGLPVCRRRQGRAIARGFSVCDDPSPRSNEPRAHALALPDRPSIAACRS